VTLAREEGTMKRPNVSDRKRYEILKQMLEDRRQEIHDKLRSLRESLPAEASVVRDVEEQSVDDFVQEVDFALMEMKSETLARIDEAIRRLEDGTYGVCEECGTEIAAPRLTALPFAALCRACQQNVEEALAQEREARVFEGHFAKAL
jgi:RNA polymerase-binding transcription factor